MTRVLLVHPSLNPPGGSNGLASWVLQALVASHRVTVLSWTPIEVSGINRFFGTHLEAGQFDSLVVPASWRAVPDHLPVPAHLIKLSVLMRYTRRVAGGFDVVFACNNETDFGRRGIQYVHYPTYLRPRPAADLRWYHPPQPVLNVYYAFADRLAGFSLDRMKSNLTLVNSNWTGHRLTRSLGIPTRTLYPPVVDPAAGLPWDARRPAFLAVGRISPEKEYERVMRILARVRQAVPEVSLTIVGTHDRHTQRYFRSIQELARSMGSWIAFRDNLTRDEIRALMASHRYGIHGMREEHFGMAPAEQARAGMIVWVPRGGGQMEVVGHEPALMYDSEEDAASKILRTMHSLDEQERLRAHLAAVSQQFTTERFTQQVREIVQTFHP